MEPKDFQKSLDICSPSDSLLVVEAGSHGGKDSMASDTVTGLRLKIPGTDRERNGYHDSDFFCTIWDRDALVEVMVGTTSSASTFPQYPDATPEQLGEIDMILLNEWAQARIEGLARHLEATALENGAKVVVKVPTTKGKSVCPQGAKGVVRWRKHGQYGMTLGIDLDDETEVYRGQTKPRRIFISTHDNKGNQRVRLDIDPQELPDTMSWVDRGRELMKTEEPGHITQDLAKMKIKAASR